MQETRSCIPVVPAGFVPRPRLDDVVEDGVHRGTVTVSAPAGAGKTLMLSSWAARRAGRTAWLSLEREDADPAHFWGHVLTALQAAEAVPPSSALATMTAPPTFDRRFVTGLLTACEALSGTTALVLDDGHELVGTPALRSLADALRRGTGSLRLVLSTRADLPLPLQRLRAGGAADRAADRRPRSGRRRGRQPAGTSGHPAVARAAGDPDGQDGGVGRRPAARRAVTAGPR